MTLAGQQKLVKPPTKYFLGNLQSRLRHDAREYSSGNTQVLPNHVMRSAFPPFAAFGFNSTIILFSLMCSETTGYAKR